MPLVSAIFTALSEPIEENDEEEQRTRRLLQRSYYLFLTTIVSNHLLTVLAALETAILQQVQKTYFCFWKMQLHFLVSMVIIIILCLFKELRA